jgi:hypothetical protein
MNGLTLIDTVALIAGCEQLKITAGNIGAKMCMRILSLEVKCHVTCLNFSPTVRTIRASVGGRK